LSRYLLCSNIYIYIHTHITIFVTYIFSLHISHIKSSRKGITSLNYLKKKKSYGNEGHRQMLKSLGQKDI